MPKFNPVALITALAFVAFVTPGPSSADSPTSTTSGAQNTTTNRLTLSLPDNTLYELTYPSASQPETVKLNSDKTVTIRVVLTFHFLDIPQCYQSGVNASKTAYLQLQPDNTFKPVPQIASIPGNQLNGYKPGVDLLSDKIDSEMGAIQDPKQINDNLFNIIRCFIPRHNGRNETDSLLDGTFSQYQLLDLAVDNNNQSAPYISNTDLAFVYADSIANARRARELAYYGVKNINIRSLQNAPGGLQDSQLANLHFLTAPNDPANSPVDHSTVKVDNLIPKLQQYGSWIFEEDEVTVPGLTNPMPMIAVRVQWGFEATFDPTNPPSFPLLTPLPPLSLATTAGASGGNEPAGSPSTSDTSSNSALSFLKIDPTALSAIGSLNNRPGFTPVVGVTAQSNDTPTLIGANIRLTRNDQASSPNGWLLDPSRFGLLVGKSQGNHGAYVFGPSLSLDSSTMIYVGGAVDVPNGNTRLGPSIGVAISLGDLVPGGQSTNNPAPPEISVVVSPSQSAVTSCAKDTSAAVLWVNGDLSSQPILSLQPIFNYTIDSDNGTVTRSGDFTRNGYFYLDFPVPGTLSTLMEGSKGKLLLLHWPDDLTIQAASNPNHRPGTPTNGWNTDNVIKLTPGSAAILQIGPTTLPATPNSTTTAPAKAGKPSHGLAIAHTQPVSKGLFGIISPPPGVSLDQMMLELFASQGTQPLTTVNAAFVTSLPNLRFNWLVPAGTYKLVVVEAGGKMLWSQSVSTGKFIPIAP